MKKIAIFLILIVFVSFSCKKEYKYYGFYIENTVEIDLASGSTGDVEFTNNVQTNSFYIFESEGTSTELIDSIYIDVVEIADSCLNYFSDLNLYISTDGVNEKDFADNVEINNPFGYSVVELNASDEKMDDYVKANYFDLTTRGQIVGTLPYSSKVTLNIRFKVHSTVK